MKKKASWISAFALSAAVASGRDGRGRQTAVGGIHVQRSVGATYPLVADETNDAGDAGCGQIRVSPREARCLPELRER